jgi:hypothetical protein
MDTMKTVRAIQSVLYSAYRVHSPPYRDLFTNQDLFKAALNAIVIEERAFGDLGCLTGSTSLQSGF